MVGKVEFEKLGLYSLLNTASCVANIDKLETKADFTI